jgi:hypothetical protein
MITKTQFALGLLATFLLGSISGLFVGTRIPFPGSPVARLANFYADREVDKKIAEQNIQDMKAHTAKVLADPRIDPEIKKLVEQTNNSVIPILESMK